jgi:hypothetical protein
MKNHLSLHIYLYPRLIVFFILNTLFVTRGQPPAGPETGEAKHCCSHGQTHEERRISFFVYSNDGDYIIAPCVS